MTIKYLDSKRISLLEADRSSTVVQGNDGGRGTASTSGAGGGGHSTVGTDATSSNGGNGGTGTQSSIQTGSAQYYSSGGGGGNWGSKTNGTGSNGGGNGGSNGGGGEATGYGNGGGGGGNNGSTGYNGGHGSHGIVIIRFTTSGNGYGYAGGTVTTVGSDTVITYTALSGTTFTPTSAFNVQYLIVAGGGGGGWNVAGGGGAGGLLTSSSHAVTAQAYTIVVGSQGLAGGSGNGGAVGGNSSFDSLISIGGGGGGSAGNALGLLGGSGGGGSGASNTTGQFGLGTSTTTDTTPANVQSGSRFEETDTRKIYHYSEATLTFSDDFSSSPNGWTLNSIGSGQSISGGALISSVSPSNGYKAFAIGDPTKFVLDLDWEFNGGDTPVVILSSDTSGYGDPSEGNRRLIIMGSSNNSGDLRFSNRWWKTGDSAKDEVNSSLVAGGTSGSTGVKYFWRFVKSGTSLSFKRYLTDSDRTSGANLQQETTATDTAPSGLVTYSYIEVSGYGSSGTNKLYDFKLYSGVTSTATAWKEEGT